MPLWRQRRRWWWWLISTPCNWNAEKLFSQSITYNTRITPARWYLPNTTTYAKLEKKTNEKQRSHNGNWNKRGATRMYVCWNWLRLGFRIRNSNTSSATNNTRIRYNIIERGGGGVSQSDFLFSHHFLYRLFASSEIRTIHRTWLILKSERRV